MASWKKIISEDTSGVASISSKLGVGTASPSKNIHISGSGEQNVFLQSSNGNARVQLEGATFSDMIMTDTGGGTNAKKIQIRQGDDSFKIRSLTDAGDVSNEMIHLDIPNNRIGIGTTSPSEKLTISGGDILVDSGRGVRGTGGTEQIRFNTSHGVLINAGNAERMRITTDGKVGIGTNSPNQIFNVRDSANSLDLFSIRSTGSEVRIGIGKNSADCAIDFSTSLPNGGGTIQNAFRMNYIDNVRTGSHNGRLVLQSNNGIRIAGYNDNPSGNAYGLEVKNTRDGASDKVLNIMKYDSTSLMTVKSNGAIGLGTDSPAHELDIQGSNSGGTFIQIRDTGLDYPCGITYNHGVSGYHTAWYAGTMDGGSGERKFTIGAKGSNGFHNDLTTSSYSLMELNDMDSSATFRNVVDIRKSGSNARHADTALMITNTNASTMTAQMEIMSGNAGYSNIYLGDTNSYSQGGFSYEHSSDKLYFRTSNATKMTLDSNGLGVGTTSPSYKLDITTGMRINRSGNDPYILLHRDGSGVGQIRGVSGGGINLTAASSSTSRLYINSSGDIGINHTSPSAMLDVAGSLKIQGNATFDQQVTHEDMVTFNSDVSFTNASIEGLSVSTSKILVLQSSAASSGQDINDSTRDIYWQSMSTENNTYVSWAAGSGGYYISFAQAGEYMVYVDLIVTDATANDRMNFFGWISHMNSSNSVYYKYPLGGTYIRDDNSLYDSGGIGGSARLIVSANDRVKVNTQRFDSQDELDDNPLSTSLSRIRIEKINYNLSTG